MRKVTLVLSSIIFCVVSLCVPAPAQKKPMFIFESGKNAGEMQRPFSERNPEASTPSSQIKDIQVFGERSGIAFTHDTLFRTDTNGATWREINLPKEFSETISAV